MKSPSLLLSVTPIFVLIGFLFLNVIYFDDPLGGANQIALMITATISGIIAGVHHVKWKTIQSKILSMINSAMPAILILLLIGALSGTWMLSGVIPTMIYYGIKLMSPSFFLSGSLRHHLQHRLRCHGKFVVNDRHRGRGHHRYRKRIQHEHEYCCRGCHFRSLLRG